jgi:hypothetical protein
MNTTKDTYKLIIRLCQGKEHTFTAPSFQEAHAMYDAVCRELQLNPLGYVIKPIN